MLGLVQQVVDGVGGDVYLLDPALHFILVLEKVLDDLGVESAFRRHAVVSATLGGAVFLEGGASTRSNGRPESCLPRQQRWEQQQRW